MPSAARPTTLRAPRGRFADIAREQFPVEFTQTLDEQTDPGGRHRADRRPHAARQPRRDRQNDELAYLGYRDEVAAALQDRGRAERHGREPEKQLGLLMVVTFGTAVALTVLVSLSITRPLRSLTVQAKEMAERRLPRAVAHILETPLARTSTFPRWRRWEVVTRDEVADVAEALNTVQDSALDLAIEQAVLRRNIADSFVNLGRRNQNLLGRQLDFITELETNETDPDVLANLFKLDHLATRMRRNAESLLVLAGIDPPRRWAEPLRLSDVVAPAVGEVEDFQRVVLHLRHHRHHRRLGRRRPGPPAGRADRERPGVLARRTVDDPHGAPRRHGGYAVAIVDSGPRHAPGGDRRRQPAPRRRRVVHHRPVQVPGPRRRREPRRPPRHRRPAAQPRDRRHRHRRAARGPAHRQPRRPVAQAPPLRTLGPRDYSK